MSATLEIDQYDSAVETVIAQCGGDARGAIKALLCANELLEADLTKALGASPFAIPKAGGGYWEQ